MDIPMPGLSSSEFDNLQQQFGKNTVKTSTTTGWHILLRQVKSPFIYLLLGAALLSFSLGERTDAAMIVLFTCINIFLGFYQEYRSEATARLLSGFLRHRASVVRDGSLTEIYAEDIVPGDVIFIESGDIIPADSVLIAAKHGLEIDSSVITGESIPVEMSLADSPLLAGTTVVSGSGFAKVTKIGASSQLGKIAAAAAATVRVSAFEKNIAKISGFTLKLIAVILVATYATNLALKGMGSFLETTLFAIALAVSVIPEALPVVVTFSLSRGALRLARHGSIVKRLSSIEDLGGIEILATDKTGTITENKLSVADMFAPDQGVLADYLSYAATGKDVIDGLLHSLSSKSRRVIDEIPFDALRRRSTTLVEAGRDTILIVKGVPEELHNILKHKLVTGERLWLKKQEEVGNRVIAVAAVKYPKSKKYDLKKTEKLCKLYGYIALSDTVKATAKLSVAQAKRLNIAIKIISGDSAGVCYHVANQIGLAKSMDEVITGPELDALDDRDLHAAVSAHSVFARITPLQKSQLIDIMQEEKTVGFIGDGVNDAPALKSADVAIAVNHAADVAREAADIILTNNSLHTIVGGIEEGRIVFGNTAKYIKMTLAANVGNFFSVAIASLFIPYLPMLPIQILLVNLLSDFPMIAVAADTIDTAEISSPQTYNIHEIAAVASIFGLVSSAFDLIFFSIFVRFTPAILQTGWFIESILTELLFFYSIRSHAGILHAVKPPWGISALTAFVICLTVSITYTAFGHSELQFVSLPAPLLLLTFGLIFVYLVATETVKIFYYRNK